MTTTTLARLHDADAATRRIALLQLADEEDADALPEVTALLAHDPAPEVRLEAARIIATWERPDTVAALARALEDADAAVREAMSCGVWGMAMAQAACGMRRCAYESVPCTSTGMTYGSMACLRLAMWPRASL